MVILSRYFTINFNNTTKIIQRRRKKTDNVQVQDDNVYCHSMDVLLLRAKEQQ
jgi:hypothetical protein